MKDVEDFLRRFHSSKDIDEVFTCDCCYWFSVILFGRFIREGASIMYDKETNHFGTKIKGRIYDITGDITDKYNWTPWESITDTSRSEIIRNYIMF